MELSSNKRHLARQTVTTTPPGDLLQSLLRLRLLNLERRLVDRPPVETPEQAALADVRAAIARFAEGQFGRCTDCGEAIETDRLLLQPQVRRCAHCQAATAAAAHSISRSLPTAPAHR